MDRVPRGSEQPSEINVEYVHLNFSLFQGLLLVSQHCCNSESSQEVLRKNAPQSVLKAEEKMSGCSLPPLEGIGTVCYLSKAWNIIRDSFHPGHHLLELLPSGRRYRSVKTSTSRFMDSFFPRVTRALKSKVQDKCQR